MPKERLKTKPLLFIRQPEFDMKNFSMQQEYSFKVGDRESTIKRIEDEVEMEQAVEKEKRAKNEKEDVPAGKFEVVQAEIQEQKNVDAVAQPEKIHQQVEKEVPIKVNAVIQKEEVSTEEAVIDNELIVDEPIQEIDIAEMEAALEKAPTDLQKEEVEIEDVPNEIQEEAENEVSFEQEIEQERETEDESMQIDVSEEVDKQDAIRALITRLARYPSVIEKPICEAVINGKKVHLQILSKRGETIKVRIARSVKKIEISEIEELSILPSWKGL